MGNSIKVYDVLKIMEKKTPEGEALSFDIVVRTFSRQNLSGGNIKRYNEARLLIGTKKSVRKKSLISQVFAPDKEKKNPNHFANRTRNLELANGDIKKINILYIVELNGKKVVY